MTVAVCVYCGSIKHGAFNPCDVCNAHPETEIDLAYSLALTDHYFSAEVLNQISAAMKEGKPRPTLPLDQENKFREAAKMYIDKFGKAFNLKSSATIEKTSLDSSEHNIRIHPAGQGHSTNESIANRLESETPKSFRIAQDILVAAKKYVDGPRIFSSRKSQIKKLQAEIYNLERALLKENYNGKLKDHPPRLVFSYLSEFSDAFPNWQPEYRALNKFIPEIY